MKLLNTNDLITAGYQPGPIFKTLLEKISEYETKGITDPAYALKLLKRDCGAPITKLMRRETPIAFSEAIDTHTELEVENREKVRRQMNALLRTPIISGGVILPDACPVSPQEAVIPVGAAIVVENAIIPSAHSADMCCSMFATFYEAREEVAKELDALTAATNFGPVPRQTGEVIHDPVLDEDVWENKFLLHLKKRASFQLADQGDGNHFAYIGEMEITAQVIGELKTSGYDELAGKLGQNLPKKLRVLVTHHGSRGLGAMVFKRGQNAAEKHTAKVAREIPKASAWLDYDSEIGKEYWEALQYVGRWTLANHKAIHRRFLENIGGESLAELGNEHNFVWKRENLFYHGKGATPAWKDELGRPKLGLIPLNMAEPILLVLGSDNTEYLSFAPHGAGRNMSRTALMREFPEPEDRERVLKETTEGIDVRWFSGKPDLSESPIAYKSASEVTRQIDQFGLAKVVAEIRPLGCIMAGHIDKPWMTRKDKLSPKQLRQIVHRADRRKTRQDLS